MNVFSTTNYKEALKQKLKDSRLAGPRLTWKKVAARVPLQYTYLSRALNHPDVHLSEDHLHEICKLLHFFPEEIEYLLVLRGLATASSPSRREYLQKKLVTLRSGQQLNAPQEKGSAVSGDVHFLLSPLAWVAYFSLGIKEMRENPRRLAQHLGIEITHLRALLNTLHDLSLIETGKDVFEVLKVNKNHFHYSADHPLTQLNQQLLRPQCDAHFLKLPVSQRHRLMATFNADPIAFSRIEELFGEFIREVEKVAVKAPSRRTYQLNFELFPWN